jgi:hypothetical protein
VHSVKQQSAFRNALLDLAAEATPTNVSRYLAASRQLDAAAPRTVASPKKRAASKGIRQ